MCRFDLAVPIKTRIVNAETGRVGVTGLGSGSFAVINDGFVYVTGS